MEDDGQACFYPLDRLRRWVAQQGDRWFTAVEAQAAVGNIGAHQTAKKALVRMARKLEVERGDKPDMFRGHVLPKTEVHTIVKDGNTVGVERVFVRAKLDEQERLLFGRWRGRTLDQVAYETDGSYLRWMRDEGVVSGVDLELLREALKRWKRQRPEQPSRMSTEAIRAELKSSVPEWRIEELMTEKFDREHHARSE